MVRILVIEDEAQMRKLLRQVLEDAGYEVEEASDVWKGHDFIAKIQPT